MISFAPVLILTLNRHEHFKNCVESLAACKHADKTDLFIALDYPLNDTHWEGYEIIKDYLPSINGFKTINIIERERNYGVEDNFFNSLEYVFNKFDRLIYSEDDNVFSPDFISFINKGLEIYKDREDIFSVSGYQYPVTIPNNYDKDVYEWTGFTAWGVGIWKRKWGKVNFQKETVIQSFKNFLKNHQEVYKFQKIANIYLLAIITMLKQNSIHGDGIISLYLYRNHMYSIFPTISRVRNTGHDGSGVNGGYMASNIYHDQAIYNGDCYYKLPYHIKPAEEINKALYQHFKTSLKSKIKTWVKLLLINMGLLYQFKNKKN